MICKLTAGYVCSNEFNETFTKMQTLLVIRCERERSQKFLASVAQKDQVRFRQKYDGSHDANKSSVQCRALHASQRRLIFVKINYTGLESFSNELESFGAYWRHIEANLAK
jgi:hypothetical protein